MRYYRIGSVNCGGIESIFNRFNYREKMGDRKWRWFRITQLHNTNVYCMFPRGDKCAIGSCFVRDMLSCIAYRLSRVAPQVITINFKGVSKMVIDRYSEKEENEH